MKTGTQADVHRIYRTLLSKCKGMGAYPLLMLPSAPVSFELMLECKKRGFPVVAVGLPALMKRWCIEAVDSTVTPLMLWKHLKGRDSLDAITFVFQDQLVAMDESYVPVSVEGCTYQVSPIEYMLVAKFSPPSFIGHFYFGKIARGGINLVFRENLHEECDASKKQAFNGVMSDVLYPLVVAAKKGASDWLARDMFVLKRDDNWTLLLSQQVQEMDSLLRIYRLRHGGTKVCSSIGKVIKSAQAELSSSTH